MPTPTQNEIDFDPATHAQHDAALLDTLGVPASLRFFEPSYASAHARAARTVPSAYARTRNALDGGVTGLSPYLTHGIISVPEVARSVTARQLYATGYLHNHAHLFNASNVAKFAPESAWKAWASAKSSIDMSYEQLDAVARMQADVGPEPGAHTSMTEPAVYTALELLNLERYKPLAQLNTAQTAMLKIANRVPDGAHNFAVELIHPWALSERSTAANAQYLLRIGVVHAAAHTRWPWSLRRWQFVVARMQAVCDVVFMGDVAQLAQCSGWPARQHIAVQSTLFEGYRDVLAQIATVLPQPKLFVQPDKLCASFSQFYERVQRTQPDFAKLIM
jgi:hypothetical protein